MFQHHAILTRAAVPSEAALPEEVQSYQKREFSFERLGIDEVREVTAAAYLKPELAEKNILIIRSPFITHEAQNALLKILEEPPEETHFFIVVTDDFQFLPTVLSRLTELQTENTATSSALESFYTLSFAERIQAIDVSQKKKDVDWQRALKQSLLVALRERKIMAQPEITFVADKLLTRGASNKMLLEHLALSIDGAWKK